jgi:hypothetical protein
MLWPLFLVGCSRAATPDMRSWAIRVLKRIGSKMGIRQAFFVAKLLETDTDVTEVYNDPTVFPDDDEVMSLRPNIEDFAALPSRTRTDAAGPESFDRDTIS